MAPPPLEKRYQEKGAVLPGGGKATDCWEPKKIKRFASEETPSLYRKGEGGKSSLGKEKASSRKLQNSASKRRRTIIFSE